MNSRQILKRSLSLAGVGALAMGLGSAFAQEVYPAKPIAMIVPFAAGGTSDVIARLISEQMGQTLGQRIVNENVAGAGGATGLTRAARAKPDGYTIAIGNVGTNAAAYTIYPDLQYSPASFAPIGLIAKTMPAIWLFRQQVSLLQLFSARFRTGRRDSSPNLKGRLCIPNPR